MIIIIFLLPLLFFFFFYFLLSLFSCFFFSSFAFFFLLFSPSSPLLFVFLFSSVSSSSLWWLEKKGCCATYLFNLFLISVIHSAQEWQPNPYYLSYFFFLVKSRSQYCRWVSSDSYWLQTRNSNRRGRRPLVMILVSWLVGRSLLQLVVLMFVVVCCLLFVFGKCKSKLNEKSFRWKGWKEREEEGANQRNEERRKERKRREKEEKKKEEEKESNLIFMKLVKMDSLKVSITWERCVSDQSSRSPWENTINFFVYSQILRSRSRGSINQRLLEKNNNNNYN